MDRQVLLVDTIHISDAPDWKLSSMLHYVYTAADNMEIELTYLLHGAESFLRS